MKDGGPAFPVYTPDMNVGDSAGPGMTLRDYFAGQALTAIAHFDTSGDFSREVARRAYQYADAMIKAR